MEISYSSSRMKGGKIPHAFPLTVAPAPADTEVYGDVAPAVDFTGEDVVVASC
jgi:hypothetical protein